MVAATPVDGLAPGDHACLTYTDADERLDLLSAFVDAARARGDRTICYTDDSHGLDSKSVVPVQRLWGGGAAPSAETMVELLAHELRTALRDGHTGLSVTADMCWATRPQANAEQLLVFESEVGRLFEGGRFTAICEYDRAGFDPVTLGYAARVHPRTVAATVYHEDPVLRICRQHIPPGVRVAGELDFTRAEALSNALGEAVRLDRDIHLNLSRLAFIDAAAAAVLLRTAAALPGQRRMVVVCTEQIGRTLRVAGADGVPSLRMLVRDGEH
ncbi:hypothetical protein L083_0175 [Actinoplanes sp. N902-109]|nr:hypothetical protein L083_0175 [Actinoplanes sp. N902-109]